MSGSGAVRCEVAVCGRESWRGRGWGAFLCIVSVAVLLLNIVSGPAFAAKSRRGSPQAVGPAAPAWITMDATTGDVLASQEPDRPGAPASMTKMMLALLVMEAIRDGQLKLTDPVRTSALASEMGGSQVYLKQGEVFPVEDMMAALLIGSANDAAVALAEGLAGTVQGAVRRMNERAAELKLTSTHFASVHGLPPGPGQEGDVTTPRDLARLSQELVKFPEILRWTSTPEAPFRQGTFILQNSNHLIGRFPGADGLKTGHFHEAGYNVAATATRGTLRLITVVMGAPSNRGRFEEAARLLEEGFSRYVEMVVAKAGVPLQTQVHLPRATGAFRPVTGSDVRVFVLREQKDAIRTSVDIQAGLRAPLTKGQPVGTLVARVGDHEIARTSVVAPAEVPRTFFWWLTPWR
ncbi:MAG: D-alanyl-D-alanine carboxypeptidase family protein [Candidatus Methylomirabilales bacterium]